MRRRFTIHDFDEAGSYRNIFSAMTDDLKFLKYYTLFGFFVIGIVTVLLGQVLPVLSSRLSLNDAESGLLLSAQFAGALLGTLSVGQLIRRLGFPTASLIGLILIALGLPALNSQSFVICWLGIFVYGSGIGMAIPAVNLLTIEFTPPERQSSAVNLLNFGWGVGAICSQPFAAAMSGGNSLVLLTVTLVVALLAVAICFIFVIRKSRGGADDDSMPEPPSRIWSRPDAWLFVAFAFFTIGVEGGIHGWLTTYSESVSSSGENWQPQTSQPTGPLMNCCKRPRFGPTVGVTQQPSLPPLGCAPSVTIHRLPALSKPTLSGEPMGLKSAALA